MDFSLSDDQILLQNNIRKFCKNELTKEYVRKIDETMDYAPQEILDKLTDIGVTALTIPEKYGGVGGSFMDFIIVTDELSTASTAIAMSAIEPLTFGARFIDGMGTEEQKEKYLPDIAAGKTKYCMALTETGGGTDVLGAMKTTAVKKGDRYIINGQKVFCTGAHVADYIMVIAITDPTVKRTRGLSVFMVDAKTPGIKIIPIKKLGVHACGTNEVFFDEVEVPEENLMGELNKGWRKLLNVLNPERITTAVFSLGIAKAAFQDAIEYSMQRQAFGRPIAQFQILQHYIADMAVAIENAQNIIYKCCWLVDNGLPYHREAVIAKLVAGQASEIAAIKGMEILGGYGYTMEYDMQRYFRDYKQMVFAPITDEMAKNALAEWMGMPRSF